MNSTVKSWIVPLVVLCVIVLFISACGGGSDDGTSSGLVYTGSTSMVQIDANNADAVAINAYENTNTMRNTGDTINIEVDSEESGRLRESHRPLSVALTRLALDMLKKSEIDTRVRERDNRGVIQQDQGTEAGPCGGSVTYSMRTDTQSGSCTIAATFTDYCSNEGILVDGSMNMQTQYNLQTFSMNTTITFTNLQVVLEEDGTSVTTSGSMTMVGGLLSSITCTMNMVMKEDTTEKTYKAENVIIEMTNGISSITVTIDGTFYDYDYGSCELSTDQNNPFIIQENECTPSSGCIIVTGADGSSGESSKAKLTIIDANSYQVEADIDGDGTYEYQSGTMYW
ncbi:MAG: hypothetical protein ACMUIP_06185 [bacterium]